MVNVIGTEFQYRLETDGIASFEDPLCSRFLPRDAMQAWP